MNKNREVTVKPYTRTVKQITVEFVCERCGRPQVYTMYPGPMPKWCFSCWPEVRKEQARERKRQQRARQKEAQSGE